MTANTFWIEHDAWKFALSILWITAGYILVSVALFVIQFFSDIPYLRKCKKPLEMNDIDEYNHDVIKICGELLWVWCQIHPLPSDHNFEHFLHVFENALKAIAVHHQKLTHWNRTCILLACLLHDVDDRKLKQFKLQLQQEYPIDLQKKVKQEELHKALLRRFYDLIGASSLKELHTAGRYRRFDITTVVSKYRKGHQEDFERLSRLIDNEKNDEKKDSKNYSTPVEELFPVARDLLTKAGFTHYIDDVIEMIDLVSASKNGNTHNLPPDQLWKLIPRECDRIEALSLTGLMRLATGTYRAGYSLIAKDTPRPLNHAELLQVMKSRPFEKYQASQGLTRSTMDYYYDKIFHLDVILSGNSYLVEETQTLLSVTMTWLMIANSVFQLIDIFGDTERRMKGIPLEEDEIRFQYITQAILTQTEKLSA